VKFSTITVKFGQTLSAALCMAASQSMKTLLVQTRYTFQQFIEVFEYPFLYFVWQQTKKLKGTHKDKKKNTSV
jgi:hypothetical protein